MQPMTEGDEQDRKELENKGWIGRPKLMRMTPELAQQWLDKNTVINRKPSDKHIGRFCKIIRARRWCPASCLFHMSKSGKLLNGQNRLHAVVKTGVTIYIWVLFDLADDVYNVTDTDELKRSLKDLLPKVMPSKTNIQGITNALWTIKHGIWPDVQQATLELFYDYEQDIDWVWKTFHPYTKIYASGAMAAFAYAHSCSKIQKKVEKFAEEITTGVGREPGSLAMVVERACLNTPKGGFKGRKNISRRILRAIKLYCEGKKTDRLLESREGLDWVRELLDEPPLPEDVDEARQDQPEKKSRQAA